MRKHIRHISAEPHSGLEPDEVLSVEIGYDKGGLNYFTGDRNERGYYLYVRPEKRRGDGTRSFTLFEGIKALVKPAARFSEKALAEIVPDPALIAKLIARTLAVRAEKNARG